MKLLSCVVWGLAGWAGLQPVCAQAAADAPADPEAVIRKVRDWGAAYIGSLPDFVCAQTTEQFRGDAKAKRWKQGDTYVSKLVFSDGREKRELQAVNGKVPSPGSRGFAQRPLTTEGEFGILLANVTDEETAASIVWSRWEKSEHGDLAVFHYAIDQQHSLTVLTDGPKRAKVGYDGEVAAEPETGRVWRITSHSVCPDDWEMRSLSTVIQYRPVSIGGKDYLLPAEATVEADTRTGRIRNRLSFNQYQKFETGSTITFGPPQE